MPIPQKDSTVNMTLDERVTPNTSDPVTTFNIHQPVVPGHDMVVNHVDGSQELAQGQVAQTIMATEATNGGVVVPVSSVSLVDEPPHRSVGDPEVNQPQVAAEPQMAVEPQVAAEPEVPAKVETPAEVPAETLSK